MNLSAALEAAFIKIYARRASMKIGKNYKFCLNKKGNQVKLLFCLLFFSPPEDSNESRGLYTILPATSSIIGFLGPFKHCQ